MITSSWSTGEYPIFLNPTYEEVKRLKLWDTLRICVDGDNMGFASGFGNTHNDVTAKMIAHGLSKGYPECFILYHCDNRFFFSHYVSEKMGIEGALRSYFNDQQADIMRFAMQCREDAFVPCENWY